MTCHLSLAPPVDETDDYPLGNGIVVVRFEVMGKPEPGGSKKAVTIPGRKFSQIVDANPRVKSWQGAVAKVARYTMGSAGPVEGPLGARFEFVLERPRSSRRERPTVKPDVLKLARAAEDALTGIVWVDDAQVVHEVLDKRYAAEGERQRMRVIVWRLL